MHRENFAREGLPIRPQIYDGRGHVPSHPVQTVGPSDAAAAVATATPTSDGSIDPLVGWPPHTNGWGGVWPTTRAE